MRRFIHVGNHIAEAKPEERAACAKCLDEGYIACDYDGIVAYIEDKILPMNPGRERFQLIIKTYRDWKQNRTRPCLCQERL